MTSFAKLAELLNKKSKEQAHATRSKTTRRTKRVKKENITYRKVEKKGKMSQTSYRYSFESSWFKEKELIYEKPR